MRKLKTSFLVIFILFCLSSNYCIGQNYNLFKQAVKGNLFIGGWGGYYVVIGVYVEGEIEKEICILVPSLKALIREEYSIPYTTKGDKKVDKILLKNRKLKFHFSSDEVIKRG